MQRFEAFFNPALLAYPFKTRKIQNRYFPQKDFSRENISNMFYKKLYFIQHSTTEDYTHQHKFYNSHLTAHNPRYIQQSDNCCRSYCQFPLLALQADLQAKWSLDPTQFWYLESHSAI